MSGPKYPGGIVRQAQFAKDGDIGDVRIMDYSGIGRYRYRVARFCPGYELCFLGDIPKMFPEKDEWCTTLDAAEIVFKQYVKHVQHHGWKLTESCLSRPKFLKPRRTK